MTVLSHTAHVADQSADAADVNANDTATRNVVNGGLNDTDNIAAGGVTSTGLAANAVTHTKLAAAAVRDAAMEYTSANSGALVARVGPNYAGASGGRLAMVSKTFARVAGATQAGIVFTFATDCVDGNPNFSAAPTLSGTPVEVLSGLLVDSVLNVRVTALTAASVTMDIIMSGGAANNVTIQFMVYGAA